MNTYHLFLEALRRFYIRSFAPTLSGNGQFKSNLEFPTHIFSDEQEDIKVFLQVDRPIMIARFGSIELDCYNSWVQMVHPERYDGNDKFSIVRYIMDKVYPNWIDLRSVHGMVNNAGFFPKKETAFAEWGGVYDKSLKQLDVLLTWQKNEKYLKWRGPKIPMYNVSYPFLFDNPWTEILRGKKVLVISPFSKSVQSQYSRREKLFQSHNVLPEFTLKTLQSFNILRGNTNYSKVNSWFEALKTMEKQISQIDFDIALLGCGAYAFPLSAFCKSIGKKAITICGGIQLLFGIYGNRWEKFLKDNGILNEYWIRPIDDRPNGFEKVENAAYW